MVPKEDSRIRANLVCLPCDPVAVRKCADTFMMLLPHCSAGLRVHARVVLQVQITACRARISQVVSRFLRLADPFRLQTGTAATVT